MYNNVNVNDMTIKIDMVFVGDDIMRISVLYVPCATIADITVPVILISVIVTIERTTKTRYIEFGAFWLIYVGT